MRILALAAVLLLAACDSNGTGPTVDPDGTYTLQSITGATPAVQVVSGTLTVAPTAVSFRFVANYTPGQPSTTFILNGSSSFAAAGNSNARLFFSAAPNAWTVNGAAQPFSWHAEATLDGDVLTYTVSGLTWRWLRQ